MSAPQQMSMLERAVIFGLVVVPFLGLIVAIVGLWGWGMGIMELVLLGAMYCLSTLGVTVGFHRLLSHRSYDTPRFVQVLLSLCGSTAAQGPVITWVAVHRRHHKLSDHEGDPHSPHLHGSGVLGMLRGLWHSHMGWLFNPRPGDLHRYVPDLLADRAMVWVDRLFVPMVAVGLLIPAGIGALVGGWSGALLGLLWGGLVRLFVSHHVTWSINSVCHVWGARPFHSEDRSTNNFWLSLVSFGESWHNNHHAFPASARHGLRWWQIDISYLLIRLMAWCGMARRVRVPTAEHVRRRQTRN